jgi:hypothetical protein
MPDRQPNNLSARETGRTSFASSDLAQSNPAPSKDRTAFSVSELKGDPSLRDQDNAQITPKPKAISLDHPRLAPPGMSGIKVGGLASGLSRSVDRPALNKESHDVQREFKGLASSGLQRDGIER